jgi:LDH2 family malate/lactate/ureidoglycolate dehydrogenase
VLAVEAFRPVTEFLQDSAILCEQVKVAKPAPGFEEVLLPGEPEQRSAERRQAEGIPIDETTWGQLVAAGERLGISVPN